MLGGLGSQIAAHAQAHGRIAGLRSLAILEPLMQGAGELGSLTQLAPLAQLRTLFVSLMPGECGWQALGFLEGSASTGCVD